MRECGRPDGAAQGKVSLAPWTAMLANGVERLKIAGLAAGGVDTPRDEDQQRKTAVFR